MFDSMDRITPKSQYLGDASKTDWVMDGEAKLFNKNVLLTMAPETVGTLLASSTYMWYGNVKAKFKTSRGAGVVTAFILFSDVKDEIDYEFIGVDLGVAQTNYYHQGITNYQNSANITLSNTFSNYHTYEIDWTPDEITWKVDGQTGRVKKRSETYNSTDNRYHYPQTPSRVQLSLWPGGLQSNAKGTVDWAGGYVDWESQDIKRNGYYYASFESVEITCYDAKTAPGTNNGVSYTYNDERGTNDTIVDGEKSTILKSILGTGTDMDKEDPSSGKNENVATVPGQRGSGTGGDDHADDSADKPAASSGSTPTITGSSGGETTETDTADTGNTFSQGGGAGSSGNGGGSTGSAGRIDAQDTVRKGSLFAGVVAVVAMMTL